MKKIFDIVTQNRVLFLIISIIFALPFISFTPFVKTLDKVDYFTLENDPDVEFYDKFKEIFGNDEFFIIAFEKDNIFTFDNLNLLKNITEDLENALRAALLSRPPLPPLQHFTLYVSKW